MHDVAASILLKLLENIWDGFDGNPAPPEFFFEINAITDRDAIIGTNIDKNAIPFVVK